MKKAIIWLVAIVLLAGLAFYKLNSNKEKNKNEVEIVAQKNSFVWVYVDKVQYKNVEDKFTENGTFVAEQDLNVSAEIGGMVEKTYVREGDFVKAGQTLAKIKADRTTIALDNAKSMLENAKNEVKRFENAYATGGVTAQQLEQIRLQLKNAQAAYNNAQIVSSDTNVKSKISGYVSSKFVEEGMIVGAGTPLFNVVNISQLKLRVNVDENRVSSLRIGQDVEISPSVGEKVKGRVTFVSPKSSGSLKFPVEVTIDNSKGALKAGMYATAVFESSKNKDKKTLVVPRSAFVGSVSQNQIFRVKQDQVELVKVKSGRNFGENVEILEGLSQGDVVVVSGQINLEQGTKIKIVEK